MKNFYSFLQKKMGRVEEDLYAVIREEKYKSFKFYFYDVFVYLAFALQYMFFGFLEFLIKFFVLIFKTPKEAYEILVAPLEKLALEEERVKKQMRPFPEFVEYHKKARLLSNRVFGVLIVAVVVVSVIITLIFPVGVKVLGATYTWSQTNWGGGGTANNAIHPTNSSGWTEYSSVGSGIVAVNGGADLELASTTASVLKTSDTDFSGGTFSSATTTGSGTSASVKLTKALHINEYTIGALSSIAVTVSSVTANSNGTWTIAFSGNPDISRIFKNDKFADSATKSWKVLSVWNETNAKKIIVVDSEGNTSTVSAPATGSGTVGRWYASISAWEAGRNADITATGRNAIERGLPYYDGAADTAIVTIGDWTTDATHYIEIYVPLSERHRGVWDNNKYRIEKTNSNAFNIQEEYVRIDGLQMKLTGTGTPAGTSLIYNNANNSNSDIRISNNIIKADLAGVTSGYMHGIAQSWNFATNWKIWNNIFYNFSGGGSSGNTSAIYINDGGNAYIYNNTIVNSRIGINRGAATVVAKNNIVQGSVDGFLNIGGTSDYNISDLAGDAPGANSKNSTVVPFVDSTNNDFHLDFRDGTGNPAMNAGADLSADANLPITTDIDGDTRSGTWDIGADDVGATLVMTHSIGTASRDFATLQAWEDARDGVLTTRNVFKIASQSVAFTAGETITGGVSGATGVYIPERATPSASETYMSLDSVTGTFQTGETLTGSTSGSTATLSTIITTAGTIEKGEAYKDSTFTAGVTIDGSTTDANHYMWLTAEPGSRHRGVWDGSKVMLESSVDGSAIFIGDSYTKIDWLQVGIGISVAPNLDAGIAFGYGSDYSTVSNNIIKDKNPTSGSSRYGIIVRIDAISGKSYYIYNNIVYSFSGTTGVGVDIGQSQAYAYNNTVFSNVRGFLRTATAPLLKNNIAVDSINEDISNNGGTWDTSSSNNISSDATAPGSNSQLNKSVSDLRFVSTASDFVDLHILDGSVAKDAGADLSATFNTDADGQTRPNGAAFDAGADEWFSSSPVYNASGTFESPTIDLAGPVSFSQMNFTRTMISGGIGKAFGANALGQLGDGTTATTSNAVNISGLTNLLAVEGNNGWEAKYYSLGLLADGTVKAWGDNSYGQLGDNSTTQRLTPVSVSGISNAIAIAAGAGSSYVLLADGTIKGWGYNGSGQLGFGNTVQAFFPNVPVCATGASAGTCFVNPLTNVVAIAAGEGFSMALIADGTVKAWGNGNNGVIGDGSTTARNTPVSVSGISNAVAIAAGDRFAGAVLADGTVKVWGLNNYGQLGINTTSGPDDCFGTACSKTPVLVCATSSTPGVCDTYLSNVVSLAGGDDYFHALLADGTVKAWGDGASSRLGDGASVQRSLPVTVCNTGASAGQCDANPLTNVVSIASGEVHSLALLADGTVKAWGTGSYGQLGNSVISSSQTPMTVCATGASAGTCDANPLTGATAIGAGMYHSLIVTGGARFSAAAKNTDSGWTASDYKPLAGSIGSHPSKAVFPTGFSGNRYLRYKAYLSTADSAFSPQLDDATVNYYYYASSSPSLISSPYNSNDGTNILGKIAWTATTTSGTEMRFQVRSTTNNDNGTPLNTSDDTPNVGAWSQYCGPTSCDDVDYFVSANNNIDLVSSHPLKNGNNDHWLQYKAIFVSTGASTPTLGDITLTYVVNAPPVISTPTASQRTSDGKVVVGFTGYDTDTATGTAHPNQVSLTMEYWNGSAWTSATSLTGSTGWTAVSSTAGSPTTYQLIWDAKTDFSGTATTTASIRVTVNDGEGANNTNVVQSAEFSLDTKNPVVTEKVTGALDGQSGALVYTISDDNTTQCNTSNNSDYSIDGLNAYSGQWLTVTTGTTTWDFASNEPVKIYSQCKDAYQNPVTLTSEAPITLANIIIKDASDLVEGQFREFISWDVSVASDFASYKVYRSTDGVNYSLRTTITDINQNFFSDGSAGAWLTQGTTYYYKVIVLDNDLNSSRYSSVVSDVVDGQGGTDVTSPTISNVSVSSIGTSQATVSWITDELSDSVVYYSTNLSYGTSKSSVSLLTSHSVTLTGLTPGTTYNFRLKSTDPSSNYIVNDATTPGTGNLAASFSFTTSAGPVISSVSVSSVAGTSATVVWNTDVDADSFIEYSINSNLSSSQNTGLASLVGGAGPLYGHSVTLTGLTIDTKYYFKVKSTNSGSQLAQDDNGGAYYTLTTVKDITPPVISSVSATLVDNDSAVITWVTNELADSQVMYGIGSASTPTTLDTAYTTSHSVGLSSLSAQTTYTYLVISRDKDSNQSTSASYTFTTTDPTYIRITAPPTVEAQPSSVADQSYQTSQDEKVSPIVELKADREAPTVLNLLVSEVSESSARITWETDEPATSLVEYGETTVYGFTQGDYDFKTSHDVTLKNMHPGTDYNYRIRSFDNVGNFTESANKVFKTLSAKESIEEKIAKLTQVTDVGQVTELTKEIEEILATLSDKILPPLIVGDRPDVDISSSFAVIKWNTDRPSGSIVAYSEEKDYIPDSYVSLIGDAEEQTTTHDVLIANLKPGTTYHFQLRSKALVGGVGKSKDFTFTTKSEAGISDLLVSEIKTDSAMISWKTTVPATTRLEYGLTSDYSKSKTDDAFNASHIVRLANLNPGTLYRYRVGGVDQNTKQFFSPNLTFVTEALPSLLNVSVESVEDKGVSITWYTDVAADSTVVYTNQKTGKITSYGDKQFIKNHNVQLEGLEQGTEYKLQVVSKDEKGNEVKSSEYSFATSKDVQAPMIFNVQTQSAIFGRDKVQTIISWKTDEPATSQVTYQEGSVKDSNLEKQSKLNQDLSTTHTAVFTNFKPGAVYRFHLENVDQSGNIASSKDFSILTPQREETVFDLIIQNFRDVFRWTERLQ